MPALPSYSTTIDRGRLDDLPWLRVVVQLHQAHRQAVRVGVVLAVLVHPLLAELGRPRLQRQRFLHAPADVPELIVPRRNRAVRVGRSGRAGDTGPASGRRRAGSETAHVAPEARQVGLPIGGPRGRRQQVGLPVGRSGHAGRRVGRPLGQEWRERRRDRGRDRQGARRLDPPVHARPPGTK